MSDLATMKQRIATELRRSNIATQIANAITDAINAYKFERFSFNQTTFVDAPASDLEADNPWMTTAERLIRSRAKLELALHVLRDYEPASIQVLRLAIDDSLAQLRKSITHATSATPGTLGAMKLRLKNEMDRSDLDDEIADAIKTAIASYAHERFWFNESRELSFATVNGQWQYDADDYPSLANVLRWDYVLAEVGDNYFTLMPMTPRQIEVLNGDGDFNGQPLNWSFYNNQLLIYPIPNDAFPIRIGGLIAKAAPASDAEANNVWMTHAEKLIRCRAKFELAQNVLSDGNQAALFSPDNDTSPTAKALQELRARTAWLTNQGGGFYVVPTHF
jgi:hypothetical protein